MVLTCTHKTVLAIIFGSKIKLYTPSYTIKNLGSRGVDTFSDDRCGPHIHVPKSSTFVAKIY